MGLWGTLRRLRADPVLAIGTVLTVALSLVLLAAGPIYSDAVAVGALRRSLVDAPASRTTVELSARATTEDIGDVEATTAASVASAFGPVDHVVHRSLVSGESFELPGGVDGDLVDVVSFAWLEEVAEHVRVTAGRLPNGDEQVAVEVALDRRAAEALRIELGQRLRLPPRSGSAADVAAVVTGLYEPIDPFAPFWTGRERLVEPLSVSASFRTATLLIERAPFAVGLSERPIVGSLVVPRFSAIELDDAEPLRRRLVALPSDANERLADVEAPGEYDVVTSAPALLSGRDRTLTVARSIVFAVTLQLAALGAAALVLVGGLGVEARRSEAAMLRARGAGPVQMVGQAVLDSVLLVGPIAVVAPLLATQLVGLLDERGALAANGLRLEPVPTVDAWVVVAIASIATVGLLAWPAWRAARSHDATSSRRRVTGAIQRSGIDLAVLMIAAASYWQLRTLGAERASTVRGRLGVDPLLVAAPTFGLIAGAFLALRVVPAGAGLAERLMVRTRSATPALAAWQLARRPHRYTRVVLLLVMAVSIGTFALAYDATWTRSQSAQAAHDVAADGRLEPNRRAGDSIGSLQLADAIEAVPGVSGASPVVAGVADIPGADAARFLAVDTSRSDVFAGDALNDRLVASLGTLRARRPQVVGLTLGESPSALELEVEVPPEPEPEPEPDQGDDDSTDATTLAPPPLPPPFSASVVVVVTDGGGVVHRVPAGSIAAGRNVRRVDFTVDLGDGSTAGPNGAISLVAIELVSASSQGRSREVAVRMAPIGVVDTDGTRRELALVDTQVSLSTNVLGFVDERPGAMLGDDSPENGLTVVIATGSSFNVVPVIHSLAVRNPPVPDRVAAVATDAWLATASVEVGDVIPASLGRVDDARVEIVAAVEAIPSIDPADSDGLLFDLPSLLWSEYQPGQPTRSMTEFWFAIDSGATVDDAVLRPPIEATSVQLLVARQRELTADPAALGALGALALGFGAATAFAVAAFVVAVAVSARERRSEFALLEALGLDARQRHRWMATEQVVLVVVGVALGTALGWALSRLVLPVVALSQDGSTVYPPVSVEIPWLRVVVLELLVIAGLAVGASIAGAGRGRATTAEVIRAGDDA